MPPATGKGTQGVFLAHCGQGEIFILLKWVVVKYSGVPLPVAGKAFCKMPSPKKNSIFYVRSPNLGVGGTGII
jgi:hypothetical protein